MHSLVSYHSFAVYHISHSHLFHSLHGLHDEDFNPSYNNSFWDFYNISGDFLDLYFNELIIWNIGYYNPLKLCVFINVCCHNLMASFINVIWAQYYLLDICIIHHYPENEGAKSWNLSKRFCSHQGMNIKYLYSSYTLTFNKDNEKLS